MLQTSARLLRLLSLLQSRRHWSGKDLSERLAVDARTVRRDVDRLRELGYPIHASSGLGGGYELAAGASVPPMLLNDDEAVAVAVALRAAAGTVGKMEDTALALLAKLDQILPARLRKRASALHAVTLSIQSSWIAAPAIDVLTQVASACRDHEKLQISYRSRDGEATARAVEPLRLAHAGHRWYLVAWDLLRRAWRTFRVDRIERVRSTGARFVPRDPPEDAATYVQRAIAFTPYEHRMRIRLQGSMHTLAERVPKWLGVLEPLDDSACALSIGADSMEGLAAFLLLVGMDFEILEGHALAGQLRPLLDRALTSLQSQAAPA
jgi:predicted DNA-binding transcriptional regulator YafY